jgi:hypothetical protein
MVTFILIEPIYDQTKSTITGIILGFILGILLIYLLSWGIVSLLGCRFLFKIGVLILALIIGVIGAVVGDAKAAYKRPLTNAEIYRAKKVFGNSLDYAKIKVAFNTRLMSIRGSKAPFNTIYLSKRMSKPYCNQGMYDDNLVHELTHNWQTQHGIGIFKKLKTATRVIFNKKRPYQYGNKEGLFEAIEKNKNFRDFNTEQQGAILADFHCFTYHKYSTSANFHEHFVRQVHYNNGYHIEVDTFAPISFFIPIDSMLRR